MGGFWSGSRGGFLKPEAAGRRDRYHTRLSRSQNRLTSVPPIPPATILPDELVSEWPLPARPGVAATGLAARVEETGLVGGTPVVFLHGLVGLNDHWEGVVERLRERARCVRFEMPLLRLSGDDCSIEGVTQITSAYLRERIGKPAVLVGNSFGGHVAMKIACAEPGLVKGLVLAGASGLYERSILANVQIRPSRAWLAKKISELFYDKSHVWESDIDRAYGELSQREGARAMVRLSRSARADHLGEKLHAVKAPTLLVWGEQDELIPLRVGLAGVEAIPDARLHVFRDVGHIPSVECPNEFARASMIGFAAIVTSIRRSSSTCRARIERS